MTSQAKPMYSSGAILQTPNLMFFEQICGDVYQIQTCLGRDQILKISRTNGALIIFLEVGIILSLMDKR